MLDSIELTSLAPDAAYPRRGLPACCEPSSVLNGVTKPPSARRSRPCSSPSTRVHIASIRRDSSRSVSGLQADRARGARERGDARTLDEALATGRAYADRLAAFAAESEEPGIAPLHWRGRVAMEVAAGEIERLEGRPGLDVWQHAIDEAVRWHARPTEAYARWRLAEATISAGAAPAEIEEAYRLARTVAADAHQAIVEQRLIELGSTAGLVLRAPEPLAPKGHRPPRRAIRRHDDLLVDAARDEREQDRSAVGRPEAVAQRVLVEVGQQLVDEVLAERDDSLRADGTGRDVDEGEAGGDALGRTG